jgi:hypothetical protein
MVLKKKDKEVWSLGNRQDVVVVLRGRSMRIRKPIPLQRLPETAFFGYRNASNTAAICPES